MSELPGNEELKEQMFKHMEKATKWFVERQEEDDDAGGKNKRPASDVIKEEQSSSKQRRTKSKGTNETEHDMKMDDTNVATKR